MIDHYDWPGGREAMIRFGPAAGPVVIAALPPFEEANRTRSFAVTMLRALAGRGIASAIPDLPGAGESMVATEAATLPGWRAAYAAAAAMLGAGGRAVHGVAIRGGALIDRDAALASRWQFAPAKGDALVRELLRTRAMSGEAKLELDLADPNDDGGPVELAGNRIARAMLRELNVAERSVAEPIRVVRLATDLAPAELKVAASPLWRRAEPDNDPALAETLAEDIAAWVRACAS